VIKNRKVQLFKEIYEEYRQISSPLRSVVYSMATQRNSVPNSPSVGAGESARATPRTSPRISAIPVSPSIIEDNDSKEEFELSRSLFEESPRMIPRSARLSLESSLDLLSLDNLGPELDFDMDGSEMFDDFVLNSPNSGSPRLSRRRDRRRRRRERARILLSQYQDYHQEEGAPLTYEDLLTLENVPCGLEPRIIQMLPVQVLNEKDITIIRKDALLCEGNKENGEGGDDSCRICLCEYECGDSVMRLPCMHIYHKQCITKWLANNKKCPQCMLPVEL
jgi:hypothetical protein